MVKLRERQRKVDIESMPEDQFNAIMDQLSEKFREIIDEACGKANKVAEPYGFKVKMQFTSEPLYNKEPSKEQ